MPSDLEGHDRRTPVAWRDAARIQPWRHPEVRIWSRLADVPDVSAALSLLRLTEPDLYLGLGRVERLDPGTLMRGEGAGWVMPAYAWGGPGRFNSEGFGCFYAAREIETAIAESVHRQERFLHDTKQSPLELRMRVLRAEIDSPETVSLMEVPRTDPRYDPEDHTASRAFGAQVRAAGLDGILYASVRRPPFPCVALYRPSALVSCTSSEALAYLWDGNRIHAEHRAPIDW